MSPLTTEERFPHDDEEEDTNEVKNKFQDVVVVDEIGEKHEISNVTLTFYRTSISMINKASIIGDDMFVAAKTYIEYMTKIEGCGEIEIKAKMFGMFCQICK